MDQRPIFLCGPSRSGTALLREILNLHPCVHISGETHYFDDLRVVLHGENQARLGNDSAADAQDYFLALGHRPYGHHGDPLQSRISRQDLTRLAVELGGSADAYLEAFCRMNASQNFATIWGEKTPRHIFRIDDMLRAYPNARVVCMCRDVRAVIASYKNWRNQGGFDFEADPSHKNDIQLEERRASQSYHPATVAMLWKGQMSAAQLALEKWGPSKVKIVKYEELVRWPEAEVNSLVSWLDLDFYKQMLDVPVLNSSFVAFDKAGGVTMEGLDRWKKQLSEGELLVAETICGSLMRTLDYELVSGKGFKKVWLATAIWITWPMAIVRAFHANKSRMGRMAPYLIRRIKAIMKIG
jgi:hypothetical protein